MNLSVSFAIMVSQLALATAFQVHDINIRKKPVSIQTNPHILRAIPPRGGLSFEEETTDGKSSVTTSTMEPPKPSTEEPKPPMPFSSRGKLNEIDFCMSPSDVSISRLYQTSSGSIQTLNQRTSNDSDSDGDRDSSAPRIMSLTRALNNASNRAVRRILLSRSWPSPEALNYSLRQVLAAGGANTNGAAVSPSAKQEVEVEVEVEESPETVEIESSSSKSDTGKKCPVPRPILNIIMKEQQLSDESGESSSVYTDGKAPSTATRSSPSGRKGGTDEQWVADQLKAFQETYGDVKGYEYAEAYMECILSLATKGVESDRVSEVMEQGVYEDSYRRILSVLKSVGVTFEGYVAGDDDGDVDAGTDMDQRPKMKIASKLRDQDICLSMIDKLNIQNEIALGEEAGEGFIIGGKKVMEEEEEKVEEIEEEVVTEKMLDDDNKSEASSTEVAKDEGNQVGKSEEKKPKNFAEKFLSWIAPSTEKVITTPEDVTEEDAIKANGDDESESEEGDEDDTNNETEEEEKFKPEDLGGVLLSAEEPTVTRQLNVLSNIVKRTLLFGGDQEILVLAKTLEADRPAFIKRWYPETVSGMSAMPNEDDLQNEIRPGVQFFNCLVELLKECYSSGVVTTLDPLLPLAPSYANSYERLTALLVEFGSGYIKPAAEANKIPKNIPKTATDEFIRFSQWEVALRQIKPDVNDYPEDLVGSWQVKDEIGGKVIGTSTVVFKPEGEVFVSPPLKGLQWRLDPGPTHLDTCTFQVLSEDGAILQYRGFMDRGARLESRFSKRSIKIRGAVSFQMRDGEQVAERDLLPLNSESGTTRFVMSKVFDLNN